MFAEKKPWCRWEMRLRFSQCELDTDRRELRRGGHLTAVEPQVFDLILYLIGNRDHVVGKDELIDGVWGGRIVSDSTLTSRITAARKAIGDSGRAQHVIRTIHRKGVRFVADIDEEPSMLPVPAAPDRRRRQLYAEGENRATPTLADKPSIAVLPFANISNDPDQEYFADGITEDIITALSKWRWFAVIARNSTFTYKGRSVGGAEVGRELGVDYVLEGRVRKADGRVRIAAQLLDAVAGAHLWAERFDAPSGEIFALQDELTRRIASAIEPALVRSESELAVRKPTENMAAWDCYLRGLWYFNQLTEDSRRQALSCFERAVALDDALAEAHIGISRVLHGNAVYAFDQERERDLARAIAAARRALELDNDNAWSWFAVAITSATLGDTETAIEAGRKAVELNASLASGYFALAVASLYHGRTEDALSAADLALRLNPNDPQRFAWLAPRASALYLLGRYDAAIETAQRAMALRKSRGLRGFPTASRVMAASYGQLGRLEEARVAITDMLKANGTERTIADVIRPFRLPKDREHYTEGLRKAGLPYA
jgi:TolB-like protein/Flp pilus assembly protein TadD